MLSAKATKVQVTEVTLVLPAEQAHALHVLSGFGTVHLSSIGQKALRDAGLHESPYHTLADFNKALGNVLR